MFRELTLHPPATARACWIIWLVLGSAACLPRQVLAEGFLAWLFTLGFANELPKRPILTPEEHADIVRLEILLRAQNEQQPAAANEMLLGILAAARGEEGRAMEYLKRAREQDPKSPLLVTMAGQVEAQAAGQLEARAARQVDVEAARKDKAAAGRGREHSIALHRQALELTVKGPRSVAMLTANSHMDLSVLYANMNNQEEARRQLQAAREILDKQRDVPELALARLQLGQLYVDVLNEQDTAVAIWQQAAETLQRPTQTSEWLMKADLNVNLASQYLQRQDYDNAFKALETAQNTAGNLDAELQSKAELRVANGYTQLAIARPQDETYRTHAEQTLEKLVARDSKDDPGLAGVVADAEVTYAKLLEKSNPAKALDLKAKAFTRFAKIGQMESGFGKEPIQFDPAKVIIPNGLNVKEGIFNPDSLRRPRTLGPRRMP